jgi:hypothetical protein
MVRTIGAKRMEWTIRIKRLVRRRNVGVVGLERDEWMVGPQWPERVERGVWPIRMVWFVGMVGVLGVIWMVGSIGVIGTVGYEWLVGMVRPER